MASSPDRMQALQAMLQKQPNDTFLLYGLALEHRKRGDDRAAIDYLNRVLSLDPNYCYAYHQKGLIYESQGQPALARQSYEQGVAAAGRSGDEHARGELEAALLAVT